MLRDESVAHANLGLKVFRLRGITLKFVSEVTHVNAQIVAALDVARPPYLGEQLSLRDHAAGVSDERSEQPIFNGRQMHRCPGTHDAARA